MIKSRTALRTLAGTAIAASAAAIALSVGVVVAPATTDTGSSVEEALRRQEERQPGAEPGSVQIGGRGAPPVVSERIVY